MPCPIIRTLLVIRGAQTLLPMQQTVKKWKQNVLWIEIGPYGPTPTIGRYSNAVWKDNLYKIRKYVQDIEKDYVEMVDLVDQVNEAQTKEMPKIR